MFSAQNIRNPVPCLRISAIATGRAPHPSAGHPAGAFHLDGGNTSKIFTPPDFIHCSWPPFLQAYFPFREDNYISDTILF